MIADEDRQRLLESGHDCKMIKDLPSDITENQKMQAALVESRDQLSSDRETLKGEAVRAASRGSSKGIQEPEALQEALEEAKRNFRSAMKLKKELVEAYNATLRAISEERGR